MKWKNHKIFLKYSKIRKNHAAFLSIVSNPSNCQYFLLHILIQYFPKNINRDRQEVVNNWHVITITTLCCTKSQNKSVNNLSKLIKTDYNRIQFWWYRKKWQQVGKKKSNLIMLTPIFPFAYHNDKLFIKRNNIFPH